MTIADTRTERAALFTVTGHDVVSVTVEDVLDGGAVRGFEALVDWLVGSPEIVIDLRECAAMDGAGRDGLSYSVDRLRRSGTSVSVVRR
jgi:anti-anti-sigma regulatory factor